MSDKVDPKLNRVPGVYFQGFAIYCVELQENHCVRKETW